MIRQIQQGLAGLGAVLAVSAVALAAPASATIQLGVYTPGAPVDAKVLAKYGAMVGRQPDIVMWYRGFGQPLLGASEMRNLRATGQTPMVTLEPYNQSLATIASGGYDSYLHEAAKIAKNWGRPLLVRFAHEMNGDWYPWGDVVSPETYAAAWRHTVSIFRGDGASNVKWVWSPYVELGARYPMAPYFPGDEWVDYVALDGYNWGRGNGGWKSLEAVFSSSYAAITQLSSRPVIIGETASGETGGEKAAWIRAGFMWTIPQMFPRVSAVIWFNEAQNRDWRINSSQASLDAYRAVVNCSLYGGSGPCEGGPEAARDVSLRAIHVTRRVRPAVTGTLSFVLSAAAPVHIGVLSRGHIVQAMTRPSRAGNNRLPLAWIVNRRRLRVGPYRVVLAVGGRGSRSRRRAARFRVVPPAPCGSVYARWLRPSRTPSHSCRRRLRMKSPRSHAAGVRFFSARVPLHERRVSAAHGNR